MQCMTNNVPCNNYIKTNKHSDPYCQKEWSLVKKIEPNQANAKSPCMTRRYGINSTGAGE